MKTREAKPRRTLRLLPCPSYDAARIEAWLADLACREGLLLRKDGCHAGLAVFERQAPQRMRYRLESIQQSDALVPDPEQLELCSRYGWEYAATCGDFYVYRTADPDARELNTDPAVQALALKAVRRRSARTFASGVLWAALSVLPRALLQDGLLCTVIDLHMWLFLLLCAFLVWAGADSIVRTRRLRRLEAQLQSGSPAEPVRDWRSGAAAYRARRIGQALLALLVIWLLLVEISSLTGGTLGQKSVRTEDYEGNLPFASMRDFAGSSVSDYRAAAPGHAPNTVQEGSDWLAPQRLRYSESAELTCADGSTIHGELQVRYYRAASPWLAQRIAAELYRTDRRSANFKALDIPLPNADFAAAYEGRLLHTPTLLLRRGCLVLQASFYQYRDADSLPPERWMAVMAAQLQ